MKRPQPWQLPAFVVVNEDDQFLVSYPDPDGGWTSTDDLDRAKVFHTVDEAEAAVPPGDETSGWMAVPFDLSLRLGYLVNKVDGWSDVEDHVNDLLATPSSDIAATPFLLVERSTRDDRYWLTLHQTPAKAGSYNWTQEYAGDWYAEVVIDVRDGSRWDLEATFTAVPAR